MILLDRIAAKWVTVAPTVHPMAPHLPLRQHIS
jgi:hypothetical protein